MKRNSLFLGETHKYVSHFHCIANMLPVIVGMLVLYGQHSVNTREDDHTKTKIFNTGHQCIDLFSLATKEDNKCHLRPFQRACHGASTQSYWVSRLVILSVWSTEAVTHVLRALTPDQSTEVR